jgi:hypothetical protein
MFEKQHIRMELDTEDVGLEPAPLLDPPRSRFRA